MNPHVRVIVLNWNGRDDTLNCLDSLERLAYRNVRITVVDNGSQDGSVDAIQRLHPDVELLCTGSNLGYAGGNNVGLRACLDDGRSQYVLILNNDTEVDEAMLDLLVESAEASSGLAVFGPSIFFKDQPDRIWFAGAYWNPGLLGFEHRLYRDVFDTAGAEPYETDYVTGCALFMSVDTLRAVGLLDERFFLVFEEVEWCYRLRALGGRCIVVPQARMWHSVSASFGDKGKPLIHYFYVRNQLLWAERALSLGQRLHLLATSLATALLPELEYKHPPPIPLIKRVYWSLTSKSAWDKSLYRDAIHRTRTAGLRDYVLRRFGNCPESIRASR